MDLGLKGKSVIVTGGGSNIGRAIVLTFAEEGANITVGEIDVDQGEKVAAAARKKSVQVQVVKTDVRKLSDVQKLVKAAKDKFGSVDALVNNVGWDELHYFVETGPEFWDKVINLNYISVLNCTKAVLEVMIPQQSGAIVSLSSDASRMGEMREAVYGGVKAAVNSFMKTIARENGRYGIRANAVCPGMTIPDSQDDVGKLSMWKQDVPMWSEETLAKVAKAYPLKKIGKPQDLANAIVFLASGKAAGHITGQVLSVSGGYSMVG
ncbi:MAG: SDR family oxidoreductase [Candidatus Lambdaproteobacteria bacterium]|nr:SDR family oxidoreductase [Candidatus Lambdaproteobacteria bacterium]